MEKKNKLLVATAISNLAYAVAFLALGIWGLSTSSPTPGSGFLGALTVYFFYISLGVIICSSVFTVTSVIYLIALLKNWKQKIQLGLLFTLTAMVVISIIGVIVGAIYVPLFALILIASLPVLVLCLICLVQAKNKISVENFEKTQREKENQK